MAESPKKRITVDIESELHRVLVEKAGKTDRSISSIVNDAVRQIFSEDIQLESVEKFRTVFENANDGFLIASLPEKKFVEANRNICAMLGYSLEELKTLGVEDIHPREDVPRVLAEFKRQQTGEITVAESLPVERKDGSVFYADISSTAITIGGQPYALGVFRDITERVRAEEQWTRQQQLLMAINRAQVHFIVSQEEGKAFDELLADLLAIAESEYGFIGEVLVTPEGQPYLKTKAITNIAWNEETRTFYDQNAPSGMEFFNLKTLFGSALSSGEPVIANEPQHDPRRGGLPEGHPPLNAFLGVPINSAGKMIAMAGVANRPGGYDQGTIDFLKPLLSTIGQLVEARRNENNRKQTEEALRESEQQFRTLFDQSTDGIFILDMKGNFIDVNRTVHERLGYTKEELLAMSVIKLDPPEFAARVPERIAKIIEDGHAIFESAHLRKDGTAMPVEINSRVIDFHGEKALFSVIRDITERKQAEAEKEKLQAQLLQAGKMEAVGRLAGGVAHDFNNMLGVILGNAELAMVETREEEPIYANLQEIMHAARRSADLTRQLLVYARKQSISPQVLDLNERVTNLLKMVERLIGEDIQLVWKPGPNLAPVKMDPTQIDQLLVNLAVNARDAIDGVGIMAIETENVVLDESYCNDHAGFLPGDYVQLMVSDDGRGMSKEVLDQLFQPFFTTKETGKGTGLGLATVYGIVKQNDGFINVYSEPGQGTTFRIYLPRAQGEMVLGLKAEKEKPVGGTETILIVEDEGSILDIAERVLTQIGYTVFAANTPGEAISLATGHEGTIHLLVTDVIMPEMNGKDLRDRLKALRPDVKVLFMSGYAADVITNRGVLDEGTEFLQKPFSINALADKVREALDLE